MNATETVLCSAGAMFDGGSDLSRAEIANEWTDHDFTASETSAWIDAGCWTTSTAADLRDAGFRPGKDTLEYRPGKERDNGYGVDPMYALCNADAELADVTW